MMHKKQFMISSLLAIMCVAWINTKSFAEPANLANHKTEIKQYYTSGEYVNELNSIAQQASNKIIHAVQANARNNLHQKLAIVLDIDETSLSNYKRMVKRDFAISHKAIDQDVLAAEALAIQPIYNLYKQALAHNVAVFFISGRAESFRVATETNLVKAGYVNWRGLYLKPNEYKNTSNIPFKSKTRALIESKGYTIVANIGDQISDLTGGHSLNSYKLPNACYFVA